MGIEKLLPKKNVAGSIPDTGKPFIEVSTKDKKTAIIE